MVDYSTWNKIDVSDDEDETHPNIDTDSLFSHRHFARLAKMKEIEDMKSQLEELQGKLSTTLNQQHILQQKDKDKDRKDSKSGTSRKSEERDETVKTLEMEIEVLAKEIETKEENLPWNVDTLSKEKFSRTFINNNTSKVRIHQPYLS